LTLGDIVVDQNGTEAEVTTIISSTNFTVSYLKPGARLRPPAQERQTLFGPTWSGGSTVFRLSRARTVRDLGRGSHVRLPRLAAVLFFRPRAARALQSAGHFHAASAGPEIDVFDNFLVGATPDQAMLELAPGNSQVLYVLGGAEGNEFVFCDNAVYYIPIGVTNPLKPGSVAFNLLTDDGSAQVQPRATQDIIVYVNAGGNSMKAVCCRDRGIPATVQYGQPQRIPQPSAQRRRGRSRPHARDATFQERYIYVLNGDNSLAVGKYTTELGPDQGHRRMGGRFRRRRRAANGFSAQGADAFLHGPSYAPERYRRRDRGSEVLDDTQYLDCAIPVQRRAGAVRDQRQGPRCSPSLAVA